MPPQPSSKVKSGDGRSGTAQGKGSITSFFKPIAQTSTLPTVTRSKKSPSSSPAPRSSPPLPALRSTPPAAVKAEIEASDDDDSNGDYSDDSLEDLSNILGRGKNAMRTQQGHRDNPYATPKAKRTAIEFHSSPLAIMPRHKFDMKALAKDARRDDATTASSMRVKAAGDSQMDEVASTTGEAVAEIVKEKSGQDAQKVLRAVKRSEPSHLQPRYCFFREDYTPPEPSPAPKQGKTSPWRLLTQGNSKNIEQHLISGLPLTIARKSGVLPDAVFEWMLDTLCVHPSMVVRREFGTILASCPEQVGRLVTADRLVELFFRLGARDHDAELSTLCVQRLDDEPYEDRDWSCLLSFVCLLGVVAGDLSVAAAESATRTLVRLSLDKFLLCNVELLAEYDYAIKKLAEAIPSSSWDNLCLEICSSINQGVKYESVKINAVLCLPISSKRTHDLRRRLAVSSLFQDDALSRHNAEDTVTLSGIISCLNGESFTITPSTDFSELRANIILLDVAVDDGSVVKFDEREDENKFNEEVDELANKLRDIWRKINDSGMKLARTEAKSVVEWVQQRMSHGVRTRRKAKASVFDMPGQQEDPFLPRQQDYMKKFLERPQKTPPAVDVDEDTIVIAGG
ncbi:hypothetical protein THASP1DRAFT_21042 [Thamnocephalis sphaerospora]|uniref:Uncharacterized protein n=1 Tax=Thamnocephalis sphaerospora TaxID=78915 RepID=A0A4P9XFY5_9FUNG|nr:hypothetical protein THASP1DRAFT_21042 [Thamnocephalis sphaerospora]|eukprot:RKP04507.1 hypothetical protein THASP1DRAFT_21042 [Thamnocephalis sphaerospora]